MKIETNFKIEKGIAIPRPKNGRDSELRTVLLKMEIGDSFEVKYEQEKDYMQFTSRLFIIKKKLEKDGIILKTVVRKDRHTRTFRVWKTE